MEKAEQRQPEETLDYFGIRPRTAIIMILLLAAFFRMYNISQTSLWTDELATYWASTAPTVHESIDRVAATQGQSPLYFLIERWMLEQLPKSEFSVRLLSLITSLISVYLMFHLGRLIFEIDAKALFASLLFAINDSMVYYAQEARAYSMGIMFVLLSQIFFLYMFRRRSIFDFIFYVLFSILTFYSHYIFASVLLAQNVYYLYIIYWKKTPAYPSLSKWVISQILIAATIPVLFFQLSGMFGNRVAWDWLRQMDLFQAAELLISMFNPKLLLILAGCFLLFYPSERINFKARLMEHSSRYFLLFSWLIIHFLFIFCVSKILGISLFDTRYFVLCLIPFFFIMAGLVHIFKSDILRVAFPGVYIVLYLGFVSIPNYATYGHFSYKITHNWRGAVEFVNKNYRLGDVILLRSGFVNENWLPTTDNRIVHDYVKAPFRSFYWKKRRGVPMHPTIYNLTYTWEKDFYPYYDMIFDKAKGYDRVWIIGVNTPNTNYPTSNISTFLEKEYEFTKVYEANYSGVYVCLMSSNPFKSGSLSF